MTASAAVWEQPSIRLLMIRQSSKLKAFKRWLHLALARGLRIMLRQRYASLATWQVIATALHLLGLSPILQLASLSRRQ